MDLVGSATDSNIGVWDVIFDNPPTDKEES
jgi:hypothetical protein